MKVVQVKCPACGNPIHMKERDSLFLCAQCNMLHTREEGAERVEYEIAEFSPNARGERIYMPFWRLYCSFVIRSKSVEGGTLFRLSQWAKGGGESGDMFVYVPAGQLDVATFKRLATGLTANPPRYRTTLSFGGVRRAPAVVTKKEAEKLADFVVVTMEAEKPGVLQRLDYELKVNDARVVYLPFISTPSGPAPAF
ncbi:MAG: hypothetical protein FJ151_01350 [Euryarchaeota archaeon]|nr:hypothetical protein [Euryarchaeota archaeon]